LPQDWRQGFDTCCHWLQKGGGELTSNFNSCLKRFGMK
jgi:hypothetical protein